MIALRASVVAGLAVSLGACGAPAGDGTPDGAPPLDASAADGASADAAVPDAEVPPDAAPDAAPPQPRRLHETGLCVDPACVQLSGSVVEFAPEYTLWTDGAAKRRWVYLPPGSKIESSAMDAWKFPPGTKFWKEFVRDGIRVETRLLEKTGPGVNEWSMVSFAWNGAQTEAVELPLGATNALGTQHDIPSRSECRRCHDQAPGRAIGFEALSLDHDGAGLTLQGLVDQQLLTVAPTPVAPPPGGNGGFFHVPGDDVARAALGYLHINCGGCHNPTSTVQASVPLQLRLPLDALGSVAQTPTYLTSVGVAPTLSLPGATALIAPGNPAASAVLLRLSSTASGTRMPPLGRELTDAGVGVPAVTAWIESLAP
jgi:hypothetical protein